MYTFIEVEEKTNDEEVELAEEAAAETAAGEDDAEDHHGLLGREAPATTAAAASAEENTAITFKSLKEIFPKAFSLIINLFSVYIFEYSIITCFADRIALKAQAPYNGSHKGQMPPQIRSFYVILNMAYQLGVFFSRSSLQYCKIKRVWILSLLQGINFVVLLLNAQFVFVDSVFVLAPMFVWVGLMGGAAYVNVMHNILEDKELLKSEKECALALSLIFNDSGVLLASIFSLVMDNTVFWMP